MEQKLARTQRIVIRGISVRVRTNMGIQQIGFAVLDNPVRVLKIRLTFTNGLDLGTPERNASLNFVQKEVIMSSSTVHRGVSFPGSHRIPRFRFLRRRMRILTLLPGHTFSYESSC